MSTSFDVAAAKTPLPAAAVKERAEKNNIKRARKLLAQWLQCINEFLRILREGLLAHEIRQSDHRAPDLTLTGMTRWTIYEGKNNTSPTDIGTGPLLACQ